MSASIQILVGTTTGNAQYVAEEAQYQLRQAGIAADIQQMDDLDAAVFKAPGPFLLCVSTYGYGDVSANAKRLYESLVTDKPSLDGMTYGVISLGDSSHAQTFCFAGKRFDQALHKLGARRLGDVLIHDASSGIMPEEAAAAWLPQWIAELGVMPTVG